MKSDRYDMTCTSAQGSALAMASSPGGGAAAAAEWLALQTPFTILK